MEHAVDISLEETLYACEDNVLSKQEASLALQLLSTSNEKGSLYNKYKDHYMDH